MSTIVTRSGKGSPLSHVEVDANFTNLNTDKIQSGNTVAALTVTSATINGGTINGTTIGATTASTGKFSDLTDTGLTSGRVIYATTGGNLTDDADMTFDGTKLTLANDASISGLTVGKGGGAVASNTVVGYQAGQSNTSGSSGTFIGYQAGYNVTTATGVVCVGHSAGKNITAQTGQNWGTTLIGWNAGSGITTGIDNTFIGTYAGQGATVAVTGNQNTSVGSACMYQVTSGSNNAALGYLAEYATTTGSYNTAIGVNSLQETTTSSYNTAVGYQAGYTQTSSVGYNTYLGYQTGKAVTSGYGNTFLGYQSGVLVTTGNYNAILGSFDGNTGGLDIRTASNYVVLSDGAGNPQAYNSGGNTWTANATSNRFSYFKLAIAGTVGVNTYTDNVANAYYVIAGGSGGVYLANTGTSWTSASDARLKNVTGTYTNALADIAKIEPVKFTWKSDENNTPQVGVLAQSVEKVVPEAITKTQNIEGDDTEYLGVRYTELIPLMIASIQELKAEVDSLKQQLGK